jgi:hypothetical protein
MSSDFVDFVKDFTSRETAYESARGVSCSQASAHAMFALVGATAQQQVPRRTTRRRPGRTIIAPHAPSRRRAPPP